MTATALRALRGAGARAAALDARWFQICFLASMLLFGALARDFAITPQQLVLTFAAALLSQAAWQWGLALPGRARWQGYLSPIVSALGICILVRAENAWAHPLLAGIAMSSKYIVRMGAGAARSHVFNPANLAAFLACCVLPGTWLSPGQWGSETLAALWFVALGGIVTRRITRWDVSLAFLCSWGALLAARIVWLEYDWDLGSAMWAQQISNGATLLFAFFMISDPMTTPWQRGARVAYAALIALMAFIWQYAMFKPNGLILMLAAGSLAVPFINRTWPHARFAWAH